MQLIDIRHKYYANLPEDVFWQIVKADPTYDEAAHPQKKGKYLQWLLSAYQKGAITVDSLDECHFLIDAFHRYRTLLNERDIMKYDTLQTLRDTLGSYLDDPYAPVHETSGAMRIRKTKEGAEKVYEDDEWAVFVPHTWEASRYYGKNSRWCTASDSIDVYFHHYHRLGPLYININRKTKKKWQFHFESQTFCDELDQSVGLADVPLSPGLRQFYHISTKQERIDTYNCRTFADAILEWTAAGRVQLLRFEGLEGETDCIEHLQFPPSYTNYSEMFMACRSITSLDLSLWDVSAAENLERMFYLCENLTYLRLDGWDMRRVDQFNGMFGLCDHLNTLTLDRCHFPFTGTDWEIFDCNRNLRTINMYDCDVDSVRFILQEITVAQLSNNVTLNLTYDSQEQRAYESLLAIMGEAENEMSEYSQLSHNLPEMVSYIGALIDCGTELQRNPLFFNGLNKGMVNAICKSLGEISKLLFQKIEINFIIRKQGAFNLTRPDVRRYLSAIHQRHEDAQTVLPLLERVAQYMPDYQREVDNLKQRIVVLPDTVQTDVKGELKRLGLSDRWHITIPALSRLMDRISNSTRKGVEHLRYTVWERVKVVIALSVLLGFFGLMAYFIATTPGAEYGLAAFSVIIEIAAVVHVISEYGVGKLKERREKLALIWFFVLSILYYLLCVYIVRPIVN